MSGSIEHIRVERVDERAVMPQRAHQTDAGYDVSIIDVVKDYGNGVTLYDTGLVLEPQSDDIYLDLVARSSLPKLGYMLANSVGIIDNGYRGRIMIQLYKFDPNAPPILSNNGGPVRVAQLIPRVMANVVLFESKSTKKSKTDRDIGGFGSTN